MTFYQLGAVLHDLLMRKGLYAEYENPFASLVQAIEDPSVNPEVYGADSRSVALCRNCLLKNPATRLELVKWEDFAAIAVPPASESPSDARERIRKRQQFHKAQAQSKTSAPGETSWSVRQTMLDAGNRLEMRCLAIVNGLDCFAAATREERGLYLQSALKLMPQSASVQRDERIAVCAFLATQVAPGSLEHLELLKINGTPGMVLWYALFAALQAPIDIVTGLPGVGQRVLRELAAPSDPVGRPTADIAFSELRVLERVGIETMARRFGHVGEVEVELVPCVTSSFSLHGRNRARLEPEQLPLEVEQPTVSPKARMQQLIGLLADTLRDMPEDRPSEPDYSKKAYSANKRSRSKSEPR